MGSTPNRAIPYVGPDDLVSTYPAADKLQAERLDALLFDTGWAAMTVKAGLAAQAGWTPQVRRIGSAVYAQGGLSNTGLAINTVYSGALTVPAGFRPVGVTWSGSAGTNAAGTTGQWIVNASGGIDLRTGAVLSAYYILPNPVWFID